MAEKKQHFLSVIYPQRHQDTLVTAILHLQKHTYALRQVKFNLHVSQVWLGHPNYFWNWLWFSSWSQQFPEHTSYPPREPPDGFLIKHITAQNSSLHQRQPHICVSSDIYQFCINVSSSGLHQPGKLRQVSPLMYVWMGWVYKGEAVSQQKCSAWVSRPTSLQPVSVCYHWCHDGNSTTIN